MAGDAALGITPVMKWNFERSCYRWLVTRHPAQFERMDFTAQILQSASRARKAFYECGWAEAKVLIRPSDGKFERTPFFDTIIRRGLRNSTRFDSSTLTEEEIEALGMHRDETLGFKLQIRQFRSTRKELPPQGRGGGAGSLRPSNPNPTPRTHSQPHPAAAHPAGGSRGVPPSHTPPSREPTSHPRTVAAERWGDDGERSSAPARRWPAEEPGWHHGGRRMDHASGGGGGGGGGGRDRWTAWDNARRWNSGCAGSGTSSGERERYADGTVVASQPPPAAPAWAEPHVASAERGRPAMWHGPPGRAWGMERREPWDSSNAIVAAGGGAGGDIESTRRSPSDGEGKEDVGGVPRGGGGGGSGSCGPGMRQTEDIRASFRRHVERLGGRRPGGLPAPPGVAVGGDGLARGGTPDNAEAGDGGLLAQGYLRLAAMTSNNDHGDDGRRVGGPGGVACRAPPGSRFDGAELGRGGKRPAEDRRALHPHSGGQHCGRVAIGGSSSAGEDGSGAKKRRFAEGGGGSPGRKESQPGALVQRSRSNSDERDSKPWASGQGVVTPSGPRCDDLARELVESERQLAFARDALDVAQVRFQEANRAHLAKREQVMAAAGKRAAEAAHTLKECSSLHSLARSCESAAPVSGQGAPAAGGGEVVNEREDASRRPRDHSDARRPPASPSGSTADPVDDMREVKLEAALLCGIGRPPVSSGGSPSRGSAPAAAASSGSGSGLEIVSLAAAAATTPTGAQKISSASSPGGGPPDISKKPHERQGFRSVGSCSPLPKLSWAIPNGVHSGGQTGGGRGKEGLHQHARAGFSPLSTEPRHMGAVRVRVPNGGVHRPSTARGALPQMAQMPGSPSASGETDSDHSDSTTGAGAAMDDHRDKDASIECRHLPVSNGRGSWGGHPSRDVRASATAPLARLAAVATAGVRVGGGSAKGLRCA